GSKWEEMRRATGESAKRPSRNVVRRSLMLPSRLVQDAILRGVEFRQPDVVASNIECMLEDLPHPPAVRFGLRMLAELRSESAASLAKARNDGGSTTRTWWTWSGVRS
ncbi:MAG: hypothetical protein H7X75_06575, partial [Burkholderiaceae bacterium]|nr:hypothetical protein [Burkholderiaceae bacterium]